MIFIHEDPAFRDLIDIVADERDLTVAIVEKDYWVVHTLWWLIHAGFELWFKGGTSLSKGFGIIERFSEDLDLKIEPGLMSNLTRIPSWKTAKPSKRKQYCRQLSGLIEVPGTKTRLDEDDQSINWTSPNIRIEYPCIHESTLPDVMSPFVRLEIGDARVTPSIPRDLSAFIHDYLHGPLETRMPAGEYTDNRPRGVRCLHPKVTLIEKLCALSSGFASEVEPAKYVRHFEDAEKIINSLGKLPELNGYTTTRALIAAMRVEDNIKSPSSCDAVFMPGMSVKWQAVRKAWEDIQPMYWGTRTSLEHACDAVRSWIVQEIE